jgi:hypothetical protein
MVADNLVRTDRLCSAQKPTRQVGTAPVTYRLACAPPSLTKQKPRIMNRLQSPLG